MFGMQMAHTHTHSHTYAATEDRFGGDVVSFVLDAVLSFAR